MKKLLLVLVFLMMAFMPQKGASQISVNVNIGNPPWWAPRAYAHHTRYYYIPEIDSYYDASRGGYFISNEGAWVYSEVLPDYYGPADFGVWHKVVVPYYGDQPYMYFGRNRSSYVRSYHPEWGRNNWNRPHDNGNHRGWYKNGRGSGNDRGDHGNHGEDHGDHGNHGGDHGDHGGDHGDHGDHGGDHGDHGGEGHEHDR